MAKEILTIEIEVSDDAEAYRILNRISFENKVVGAKYKKKDYLFNETNLPKHFLKKEGEYLTDEELKNGCIK